MVEYITLIVTWTYQKKQLKAGIFDVSKFRQFINDPLFIESTVEI